MKVHSTQCRGLLGLFEIFPFYIYIHYNICRFGF